MVVHARETVPERAAHALVTFQSMSRVVAGVFAQLLEVMPGL
jgi:hypothetical protein